MSNTARALIIAFSVGMILISFAIGWWAKRKANTAKAYFGSTGMFGPLVVGLSSTAAVASAFALVGIPGILYATGNAMTFWMLSSAAFAMAYIIIGKKVRAMAEIGEVASLGDVSDLRFNNNKIIKGSMSITLLLGCIAYLSAQIKAGSELFSHLVGWSPLVSGLVIFGVLTIYMSVSGEVGGLLTQAFQGFVMVLAGLVLVVAFFRMTGGGFGEVLKVTSEAGTVTANNVTKEFSPGILDAWGTLPKVTAMAYMLIPILGTVAQPQVLTRMYALKNPKDMPRLGLYSAIAHTIVGLLTLVVASGALYLVGTGKIAPLDNPDRAIYEFADYSGLIVQLFVYAAVLAAAMSSASLFLSISSNIIIRDLPDAFGIKLSEEKQMKYAKGAMAVIGIASIFFSITQGEMVAILGTFGWGTLMSATFPVFILGLLWKKASVKGVMAGSVMALILNIVSFLNLIPWPGALPWYFNVITISIITTVVVSLLAKDEVLDKKVEAVIEL